MLLPKFAFPCATRIQAHRLKPKKVNTAPFSLNYEHFLIPIVRRILGTCHNKFVRRGPTLSGVGGGGGIEDSTYLLNIKFELTEKYLASNWKSALLDKQEK